MESPLKYDEKVIKEFSIDKDIDQEEIFKLAYVRSQLDEIKKFLWRERVDLILSEVQAKNANEALAAEANTKIASHRNNITGIVASVRALLKLQDELAVRVDEV